MNPIIIRKELENEQTLRNIFLPTNQQWRSTESDNLSVWESGGKQLLFKRIIELIYGAKTMICLQSFLIQDTKIIDSLLKAATRGIKVYVMDSAGTRLEHQEEDEHFSTTEYKRMLNTKFLYHFVHRQANSFHAKFIVIDPKENPKGVMFTGNFNEKPFKENPELGVELNEQQVKELFQVFVYHFWEFATDEQNDGQQFTKLKPANKFKRPKLQDVLLTSPDKNLSNLKKTLLEQIKKAKQSIFFSTFGFDITNDVSKAILDKLEEGIMVTIFCRHREKAINGNLDVLANKGAEVFCHPLIHAKSIVIDTHWGAIFSANFEKHGMDESFEVGVELNTSQKDDLLKIYRNWEITFPYKFKYEEKYAKLPHNYAQLSKGQLKSFVVLADEKQLPSKMTVNNLNELIVFVEQKVKPISSKARKIIQEKEVNFKPLKEKGFLQEEAIAKGVSLVQYEEVIKQKKTEKKIVHEVLLFDNSIDAKDLENIVLQLKSMGLKNYKVYMS